jgi:hypothetical protein
MTWHEPRIINCYEKNRSVGTDEAQRAFVAFKQFMVVAAAAAAASETRAPSREIDEMWHTAILFTRAYEQFCARHLGQHVHHEPLDGVADVELYAAARDEAAAIFGELDARYWPLPGQEPCAGSISIWDEPAPPGVPFGAHRGGGPA